MKSRSLLFCLSIMLLFGFRSHAQTISITDTPSITSDTICAGTSVTFTADTTGVGPYGYTWVLNGTNVGTSSPSYTVTLLSGVNTVYCRLSNAAFTVDYGVSDTITVTVDTLPVNQPITALTTPASVCIGDSISLTDAATGGTWASGNTVAATVSSDGMVTGLSIPGGGGGFGGGPTVRIYYILTNGCGSDSSRIRVAIAAPAGPISILSSTICIDSTVILSDTAGGGTWVSSDSTIASFMNFGGLPLPVGILTGNVAGTVTITYNVTNACGTYTETVDVTVVNCNPDTTTAVSNIATIANSCNIYPNPSTGSFSIVANSSKYTTANCTVSNMVGETVKQFTISTNQESSVNLNIPTGVYFITVSAGDEKYTTKVVIME